MTLLENDKVVSNDRAVADIFNDYFVNITGSLDIADADLNLLSFFYINLTLKKNYNTII